MKVDGLSSNERLEKRGEAGLSTQAGDVSTSVISTPII